MAERRINLKAQAVAVPAPVHETAIFRSALAPAGLVTTWDERVKTLFDSFQVTLGRVPKKDFLGTLINVNGKQTFQWQTYEAVWERIQNLGSGLVGLGLQPGDRVGIYMQNQAEWVISEHACYAYSFVPVALYDTLGADAVNFVIDHAEIGTVICNEKTKANVLKIEAKSLRQLVVVAGLAPAPAAAAAAPAPAPAPTPAAAPAATSAAEGSAAPDSDSAKEAKEEVKAPASTASPSSVNITSFQETEALGQQKRVEPRPPAPNDLATIMYTSGTTGNPKGVMLPHLAFVAEVAGGRLHMGDLLEEKSVHMSYLPLAHSFERSIHAILTSLGASIGFFTGNIVTLFDEIAILRPTFLAGAPRVWQRLQQRVLGQVEKASFVKKLLFKKALAMKQDYLKEGEDSTPILDSLVFDQTKNKLGGRVRFIFSGAAPLDSELARFLKACFCCPIMQGYGLTETCAGSVITNFHDNTVGHVGAPLPCNEIKLESVPEMNYHASDRKGEILIRGPNVFTGYFKDPQKTAEDLSEDGWFHTGDIGYITDAGCLSIIDRKKNIFKLSQGEYVAAEYLESVYSRAFPVGQIFVYGDSFHAFLVAVIVPNFELLQGPAQDKGLKGPAQEHLNHPAVLQVVKEALDAEGKKAKLHGFEFLKAFHLDPNPFTIENGLLTPSFKPRRPDLKNHYKAELDRMYAQEPQ